MDTFIPTGMWGSMQNVDFAREWSGRYGLRRYGYDVGKARQLLDGAGWVVGSDGVRAKGGVRLSVTYATQGSNRVREEVGRMVAGYLEEVGMEVEVKVVGTNEVGAVPEYVARREFDMYEHGTMMDVDVGGMEYSIGRIPEAGNGYVGTNYSGWRNGRFDELARLEEVEVDRAKGGGMLAEMQAIWSEEVPSVGLYGRATIEVHKVRLVGWETSGVTKGAMYKVGAMYFK